MSRKLIAVLAFVSILWAGSAAGRLHTIAAGETLSGISQRYGVSVASLARANDLADPDFILAGSRLRVPEAAGTQQEVAGGQQEVAAAPSRRSVAVPTDRARLAPHFTRYAADAGVPADLAMALAWQESGWQAHRVSSTDAVGVMQLMPATVDFVSQILLRQDSNLDPHDPAANIRMGTRFLRYLLDRNDGDVDRALASYYQGLRSVRERGVFDETKRFVANVKALRERF